MANDERPMTGPMTWVKICGITNLEDALVAVEAGADAVGFVFYEKSPRNMDPERVRQIVSQLPEIIEKVGVVVNQTEDRICAIADVAGLTAVQMHGDDEDPHVADLVAQQRKLKILVGISMQHLAPEDLAMMWAPDNVHAFLADSGSAAKPGGTGEPFNWDSSLKTLDTIQTLGRLVVAGGLTPENVGDAMGILHPWGVDVSSGVEAKPGKKDPDKIRAFVKAVREADKANSN
jgi:phosphoribosylanthranilate isomerase